MNELKAWLAQLTLGEAQSHKHIQVVPLIGNGNGGPIYITLGEALQADQFVVNEVSQGGSVPELKVTNHLDQDILLLDGEELRGAKQNRVLNTTILVKAKSDIVVPVSCTEQGRWAYAHPGFHSSDVIMAQKARMKKSSSVSESLAVLGEYKSDQGEVWAEIAALHAKAGTHSPTGAMHDAFVQQQANLENALKAFPCLPSQIGLLVLMAGEVVGFDLISRPEAYAKLHLKLLKSYLIDSLSESKPDLIDPLPSQQKARSFLDESAACQEQSFSSVGQGHDCRFRKTDLAGSALVADEHVVHAAFFRMNPADGERRMTTRRQLRP